MFFQNEKFRIICEEYLDFLLGQQFSIVVDEVHWITRADL